MVMQFLRKRIGKKISRMRLAKGFTTQKELAKALGVKPSTVGRWESGRFLPTGKNLSALSEFLGVPREMIVSDAIWESPNGKQNHNKGKIWEPLSVEDLDKALARVLEHIEELNERLQKFEDAGIVSRVDSVEKLASSLQDELNLTKAESELIRLFREAGPKLSATILSAVRTIIGPKNRNPGATKKSN
jgi:transcriptional regulator with XRE-family HTH domain